MGKTKLGILDGFSGKVGPVVGMNWKGKQVLRSYIGYTRHVKTQKQKRSCKHFAVMNRLVSQFRGAASIGLRQYADRNSSTVVGSFIQLNHNAVSVDMNLAVSIDYTQLKLSDGTLDDVVFGTPEFTEGCQVHVPVLDPKGDGVLDSLNDHLIVVAYCPVFEASTYDNTASRRSPEVALSTPSIWVGQTVHLFAFVQGGEGFNLEQVSPTVYIGQGKLKR